MKDASLDTSASEVSQLIHAKKVSCREVMQGTLARIRAVNPNGYLLKPVMPEELEAAIVRALETGPDHDDA